VPVPPALLPLIDKCDWGIICALSLSHTHTRNTTLCVKIRGLFGKGDRRRVVRCNVHLSSQNTRHTCQVEHLSPTDKASSPGTGTRATTRLD
jgi:hypothetical protein